MKKLFKVSLLLSAFPYIALCNQTAIDYGKDKSIISTNQGSVINSANTFDPNKSLPDYNPNPSQTQYYKGVDQTHSDIDVIGKQNLKNDVAGSTVYDNFATRKPYKINTDAPEFDDSKLAKNDSYNITHGISDQYIDCDTHKTCHMETEEKQCKESSTITLNCTKTAISHVHQVPYKTSVTHSGNLHKNSQTSYSYTPNEDGSLNTISLVFGNKKHNSFQCNSRIYKAFVNGVPIGLYYNNHCSWEFYWLKFSKSNLNMPVKSGKPVSITFKCSLHGRSCPNGGLDENIDVYTFDLSMQVTRYKPEGYIT